MTAGEAAVEYDQPSGENEAALDEPDEADEIENVAPPLVVDSLAEIFDDLVEHMATVKETARINSLLKFILQYSDTYESLNDLRKRLKDELGMSSSNITSDPASWRRLVHAALMLDQATGLDDYETYAGLIKTWFAEAIDDGGVPF